LSVTINNIRTGNQLPEDASLRMKLIGSQKRIEVSKVTFAALSLTFTESIVDCRRSANQRQAWIVVF
jgi:hypothetical protein